MRRWRKALIGGLALVWFVGFIFVGEWIFGAYYGPICRRHAQVMGWEYEDFSVGRRRGANRRPPSCSFRVPAGDGESELRRVVWDDIPKSSAERLLIVIPWLAGFAYFLPLIGVVVWLRRT